MLTAQQNPEYHDAIESIIRETSYQSGKNYFSSLLTRFHHVANTDYVFIGRLNSQRNEIETVVVLKSDQVIDNFAYSLVNTPCNNALNTGTCSYVDHICEHFPKDQLLIDMEIEGYIGTTLADSMGKPIGILAALFNDPIQNLNFVESLFNFFSSQIATALINDELQANLEQLVARKTEELQAEIEQKDAALEISEKLFEFSPDALIQIDTQGNILKINSKCEQQFGYSKQEISRLNIDALVPVDFRHAHKAQRLKYIENPSMRPMGASQNLQALTKRGEIISVEITLAKIDSLARSNLMLVSVHDVSEHRILEESLRYERNRAELLAQQKTRFLAEMSHEIRTPMNGVLGVSELLLSTKLNEQQQEYLDIIISSGNTLTAVINDILDYTKISEGKLQLDEHHFEFRKWVNTLVAPHEMDTNNTVPILTEIDEEIPQYLIADSARLYQIFTNLLSNAIKFTIKGSIKFKAQMHSISNSNANILFSVTDTGIGIPEDAQERIFESFEQEDITTSRKYGGTGLGLSICKELVHLAKGEIWLDSKLNKGSTFYVQLDVGIGNKPKISLPISSNKGDLSHMRVLLVEDNPTNQLVCKGMLNRLGITNIALAKNGKEAFLLIRSGSHGFDFVLMDCEMPIMNGYDSTRMIRKWELKNNQTQIPIIALTAHVLPDYIQQAVGAGMNFHLAKPLQLNALKDICTRM